MMWHKRKAKPRRKVPLQRCTFCGHKSSLEAWRSFHGCYYCGNPIVACDSLHAQIERKKQRKGAE
jgi:hypothetical protein